MMVTNALVCFLLSQLIMYRLSIPLLIAPFNFGREALPKLLEEHDRTKKKVETISTRLNKHKVDSGRMDQKRIVAIAVDGSDYSKEAYKYYLSNIRIEGDALYLLYCVELNNVLHAPNWYSSLFTYNEQLLQTLIEEERERIKQRLETFATWLKEDGIKGTVRSVNAESPGPGIVTTAEEIDASLIITGTRGHGMLRRTLLGSVSDYVIRHAHVPVMVCGPKSDK